MKLDRRSLVLLLVQLALVSSIAAKYHYQRATCPRVWTRAVAYDPQMILRGRYMSMQLHVDACGVALPIAKDQPANPGETQIYFRADKYKGVMAQLPIILGERQGRLVVQRIASDEESRSSQDITLGKSATCSDAVIQNPVDFYLPESAKSPFPLVKGSELWVEVTIPPKGPPRPLNLALSNSGQWQPLNF